MPLLSDQIIHFYRNLQIPQNLPKGIETLYPQRNPEVMKIVETFFTKYYSDSRPRHLLFGINPGRFGAGTTGINFTGPRQLTQFCKIDNNLKQQSELSAEFIYEVIERYGGVGKFYGDFFLTAISPLGYTRDGLNMNYYDDRKLQIALEPFIIKNIQLQLSMGFRTDACICIGGAKNYKYFSSLNEQHQFFKRIIPLPHPRFILQYKRPGKEKFIQDYLSALKDLSK